MTTIARKYEGTREIELVRHRLREAAFGRRLSVYQEVTDIMGLPVTGHHTAREVGQLLGEISLAEHQQGRPLLSSLVVSKVAGTPGGGYFRMVAALVDNPSATMQAGRPTAEEYDRYWKAEVEKVYAYWNGDEDRKDVVTS